MTDEPGSLTTAMLETLQMKYTLHCYEFRQIGVKLLKRLNLLN